MFYIYILHYLIYVRMPYVISGSSMEKVNKPVLDLDWNDCWSFPVFKK